MVKEFKVIKAHDEEWNKILRKSSFNDFYHTQIYHQLQNEGKAVLFFGSIDNNFIAFPMIIRKIFDTDFYDCTSVYGYCGPISNLVSNEINKSIKDYFSENLKKYFEANNIISCFSRLHPIFKNENILEGFGKIISLNKTINIDLTTPIDEQRKLYRKSNKYEINKLRKNNFRVEEATTEKDIDIFIKIYNETMQRVNASSEYFFDKLYFIKFLRNSSFDSKLLLAKKDGVIAAGAIFTVTNKVMQYHLAGTSKDYIRDTPMKLILDEARLIANDLNLEYLHLGGGVGGSDEDSLYRFKAGFSNQNFRFKIWQYIVNKEIYESLVSEYTKNMDSNFFPLYRD